MSRVIAYRAVETEPVVGAATARKNKGTASLASDEGYVDKLVKYIPGEAIAFYTPLGVVVKDAGTLSGVVLLLIGTLGVLLYVGYNARRLPGNKQVLPHYYVLSVVAFAVWATNTNPQLGDAMHLSMVWRSVALAASVFLFPALDDWLASQRV